MARKFMNRGIPGVLGRVRSISRSVLVAMGVFAGCGLLSPDAHAGLIGASVHARVLFPNVATTFEDGGTMTIANGTTFNFGLASLTAVFTDTRITITNTSPSGFLPASFNGLDFAFLSGAVITSVIEDPSSAATFATGSVLIVSGNDIRLNVAGTCFRCVGGEQIVLDVTTAATAAVPEPASTALLAAGLLGVGFARRRRRGARHERPALIEEGFGRSARVSADRITDDA